MNNKFNPIWLIVGGLAAILLFFVIAYIGGNNAGARAEAGIVAAHDESRNVLGQYAPRLREALGVTKIQAKAVEDIITGANESRYGKSGSQATMQWITEQNPNLDQSNYGKIIDIVSSGRNDFQAAQKVKIDKIRTYETQVNTIPGGFFIKLAGYPTPGFIEKYRKIVVSGHANDAFATGIDDGVKLDGL